MTGAPSGSIRLEVRALSVKRGERCVLDAVDLKVAAGEVVGLLGPNGAGKSTLFKAVAGVLDAPIDGTVVIDGTETSSLSAQERARRVAFLPQGVAASWPLRVRDIVGLGRLPHRRGGLRDLWGGEALRLGDRRAVARALEAVDLAEMAERPFTTLSEGERARALLARTLAVEAPLLLTDEPAAHLDPRHQLRLLGILRDEARRGHAVVVILHDLSLAARTCDRVIVLDQGRIAADGVPDQALDDALLCDVFGLRAARGTWQERPFLLPWEEVKK